MTETFRHEALFYSGEDEFLAGTVPFLREAVEAGEPALVAVFEAKAERLKAEINGGSDHVLFVDMLQLGRNPACIIPAWRAFVDEHATSGRPFRGIGEPIWPGRRPEELVECHHHESLLNLAFDDGPPWWLLCPYDTSELEPEVVQAARRTHPLVAESGHSHHSDAYLSPAAGPGPFEGPLTARPEQLAELEFSGRDLVSVRTFVAEHARRARLGASRVEDLVLAVNELATNSLRHAGGAGVVRAWREPEALVVEVLDNGRLEHPLAGRERPDDRQHSGRGLWLVNHLCDLVQIRAHETGNLFRLYMRAG